ncbi:MAG: hypothetical protein Q7S50_00880 [bacterium]|nr:hypothetical protein [bacterium]
MSEMLSRMVWFVIVAVAISYATYITAGSIVNAQARGAYKPVMIRDVLGPGSHHLSGMIMVPTPCHELTLRTEALSAATYELLFRTWHEPSVDCDEEEIPRPFRAVLFAPSTGVEFIATLDGVALPIQVLPSIAGH